MTRSVLKRKFVFLKNRRGNNLFSVFLFLLVILIAGCARQVPLYHPLSGERKIQAGELLANIQARQRVNSLDADVTVTWSGYGREFRFTGGLQAVRTGRFRLSGLDPLGRPVFFLVINDTTFTFINTRQGSGYTGPVDSDFLHRYMPAGVTPATLFELLTAQLPDIGIDNVICGRDAKERYYWFTFPGPGNLKRMAEVDAVTGLVLRQMIVDEFKKTIIDIHYDDYPALCESAGKEKSIFLPAHLDIEGDALPGSITLIMDTVYPDHNLSESLFTLIIPDYYRVDRVN